MAMDLAKIKRNVAKMVSMNAPETDIDAYISSEGATVDAVRNYRNVSASDMVRGNSAPQGPTVNQSIDNAQREISRAGIAGLPVFGGIINAFDQPAIKPAVEATSKFNQAFQQGATQGMTLGFGDELLAGAQAPIQMGIDAVQGKGFDPGASYNTALDAERATEKQQAGYNPLASAIGEGVGAVALGGSVPSLASKFTNPLAIAAMGGLEGGMYGAAYGAGKGETTDQRLNGALLGGGTGAVAGAVLPSAMNSLFNTGKNVAQKVITGQSLKNTPTTAAVKSVSKDLFKTATGSDIAVSDNAYFRLMGDIQDATSKFRPNAATDPKAVGVLEIAMKMADDVATGSGPKVIDIQDLHILRQAAQKAQMSAEGRDATIAGVVINKIDDFVKTLKPSDILGNANPTEAANALIKGISTWHKAGKMSMIEEAIRVGQLAASGPENGIRNALRSIAKNPKKFNQFSKAEQAAILDVVNGSTAANITKLLGKFGFGTGNASNMLGGSIGASFGAGIGAPLGPLGSAAGAALLAGGGTLSRKMAEKLTEDAAQRAVKVVGAGNVPSVNWGNFLAPGTSALSGNVGSQMSPPRIYVKGGAN